LALLGEIIDFVGVDVEYDLAAARVGIADHDLGLWVPEIQMMGTLIVESPGARLEATGVGSR
jgi:hypothetical protein